MSSRQLHDFKMFFHRETDKAIQASEDGDESEAVWLPKSQIEYEIKDGGMVDVTIPEWLASEKKFAGF